MYRRLDEVQLAGQRVLVRSDLNLPAETRPPTADLRLERAALTLRELSARGAKVMILAHRGWPEGRDPSLSLAPLAEPLSRLCGKPVRFCDTPLGPELAAQGAAMASGELLLLENLRYDPGEIANDPAFADRLAGLGDFFVSDAFSCLHRAHASIEGLPRRRPTAVGRALQKELEILTHVIGQPRRPWAVILGGAHIAADMALLKRLAGTADILFIGGAVANTFLLHKGLEIGRSMSDPEREAGLRDVLATARMSGCDLILPTDVITAARFTPGAARATHAVAAVPAAHRILDIGPASVDHLIRRLESCKTLLWNGPLGAVELPPFDQGTNSVAEAAARLTRRGSLLSIAGGSDTVTALLHAGHGQDFTHLSISGGAFLSWLEGKSLPGLAVLAG